MKATTFIKYSALMMMITGTINAQQTIEERQKRAQEVELFYDLAVKAYEDGDLKAAREALSSALTLNRSHAHSIALARRINSNGNQTVLERRKRIFSSVMVPIIDLNEASFKDAITVLGKTVETESKGEVIPNFIIQDRSKILENVKINLTLKNVPAGDVLDHLLKSAGASATFGTYTTVIRPRTSSEQQSKKEVAEESE